MLKAKFAAAGLPLMPSVTHIVPLLVGCPVKAKRISDILLAEYGLYVQPINFPTVPRGTERLRFTPGPNHSAEMMDELTEALVEIWSRDEIGWRLRLSYSVLQARPTRTVDGAYIGTPLWRTARLPIGVKTQLRRRPSRAR